MPAGERPCGGPGHTGHGTVGSATAWPPGRAFVAGLGSCRGCCWALRPCTDLSLNAKHERSRGPSHHRRLCCPAGSSGTTTPSDALPARCDFPLEQLYAPAPPRPQARGRGGPPQFPPPPSARSAPLTPGGSSTVHARLFPSSMAFALLLRARLLLGPFRVGLTTRQASLHAADRTVAPPTGALDAALRRRAFPPNAGSLLPGLLAATRTGLAPAGGDELADTTRSRHEPHLLPDESRMPSGHAVGTPAPQDRVEPVQQGGQLPEPGSAGQRPDRVDDGGECLLRRVGVDADPVGAPLSPALDVPAEKVEALVKVDHLRLGRRQA